MAAMKSRKKCRTDRSLTWRTDGRRGVMRQDKYEMRMMGDARSVHPGMREVRRLNAGIKLLFCGALRPLSVGHSEATSLSAGTC